MKYILLTTAAALGLSSAAIASTDMDSDGDGMVTWEEVQAAAPDVTEDQFKMLDANGDGALDADEVSAAREAGQLPAEG